MDDLDLDINNYNMHDLERFFQISPNQKYSAADIEEKEVQIRDVLISSRQVDKTFQRDLIEFLSIARDWIIFVKCGSPKQPSVLPPSIDNTSYKTESIPRTDELLPSSQKPFTMTQNSDFFRGTLNPLNNRIMTQCLNIDTRFRKNLLSTQSSNFLLQLPSKINKVVSMTLSSVELPVTFYGISHAYGNNFFHMSILFESGNTLKEQVTRIVIDDGNYNVADLVDIMNSQLSPTDASGNLLQPDTFFSYIHFIHDITESGSGTGKLRITPNTKYSKSSLIRNITLDFRMNIDGEPDKTPILCKMGFNLGFLKSMYTGSVTYIADAVVEPSPIRYIYLAIDDFNNSVNNHFISVFPDSILNANILARISIKGSYFSLLMENDFNIVSEPRRYFGPVDIQRLQIRLLDEHGRVLQMNNANFSFCLNLKTVYDL